MQTGKHRRKQRFSICQHLLLLRRWLRLRQNSYEGVVVTTFLSALEDRGKLKNFRQFWEHNDSPRVFPIGLRHKYKAQHISRICRPLKHVIIATLWRFFGHFPAISYSGKKVDSFMKARSSYTNKKWRCLFSQTYLMLFGFAHGNMIN